MERFLRNPTWKGASKSAARKGKLATRSGEILEKCNMKGNIKIWSQDLPPVLKQDVEEERLEIQLGVSGRCSVSPWVTHGVCFSAFKTDKTNYFPLYQSCQDCNPPDTGNALLHVPQKYSELDGFLLVNKKNLKTGFRIPPFHCSQENWWFFWVHSRFFFGKQLDELENLKASGCFSFPDASASTVLSSGF